MKVSILMLTLFVVSETKKSFNNGNNTNEILEGDETSSRVLSRRKRFLIFPDGSSFQLVFCVQTAAVINIGDIFLFGNTAALAWNLPADPKLFNMFKEIDAGGIKRSDSKSNIYYIDENGKVLAKVPYKRRTLINPAFAKRSVDEKLSFKEKLKIEIDRRKMHEQQLGREYLKKHHMDDDTIEFHRSSRIDLFPKLEALFTALGRDGRQCVLYKLCESAQASTKQGTFLQEFLRVVFTLPKTNDILNKHKEYDTAHSMAHNCAELYPGCEDFTVPIQL